MLQFLLMHNFKVHFVKQVPWRDDECSEDRVGIHGAGSIKNYGDSRRGNIFCSSPAESLKTRRQ